jgi:hypothetical protein
MAMVRLVFRFLFYGISAHHKPTPSVVGLTYGIGTAKLQDQFGTAKLQDQFIHEFSRFSHITSWSMSQNRLIYELSTFRRLPAGKSEARHEQAQYKLKTEGCQIDIK